MNTLSLDLCRYLTLYLSRTDLKQLRCVSHIYHRLCNDELTWKLKLAHDYPVYFRPQGVKYQLTYRYLSSIETFHDFSDSQDPFAQKMKAEDIAQAIRWSARKVIYSVSFVYPVPFTVVLPTPNRSQNLLVRPDIDIAEHKGQLLIAFNQRTTTMGPLPAIDIPLAQVELSQATLQSKYGSNVDASCYNFYSCDKECLPRLLELITDAGYYQTIAGSLYCCIRGADVMTNPDLFTITSSK